MYLLLKEANYSTLSQLYLTFLKAQTLYIYIIIYIYIFIYNYIYIYFFYKCFDQMWLNEEARIAQVANINQLPGTHGFTSPPKDAVMITSSFLRVELSTLIGEKSLNLVGLEPATFRLQASTLTSWPLVPLNSTYTLLYYSEVICVI